MKVQREIWVEICDFCNEDKAHVCELCGKDICSKHALRLETAYTPSNGGMVVFSGYKIAGYFCPSHLSEELMKLLDERLKEAS